MSVKNYSTGIFNINNIFVFIFTLRIFKKYLTPNSEKKLKQAKL